MTKLSIFQRQIWCGHWNCRASHSPLGMLSTLTLSPSPLSLALGSTPCFLFLLALTLARNLRNLKARAQVAGWTVRSVTHGSLGRRLGGGLSDLI